MQQRICYPHYSQISSSMHGGLLGYFDFLRTQTHAQGDRRARETLADSLRHDKFYALADSCHAPFSRLSLQEQDH